MSVSDGQETARVSIAVHGIGDHAKRTVLPAIEECDTLKLVGISTRNASVLEEQSAKWTCAGHRTLDELLVNVESDVVLVSTPIGCHFEDGRKVLAADRHLWCEKSFTNSLADAEELARTAAAANRALCVSFGPAYHPMFDEVKRIARSGKIGRPQRIRAKFGFPHTSAAGSKYDPSIGGGALLDVGYYTVLIANYLLDEVPNIAESEVRREAGFDVDTDGACRLVTASGIEIICEWGYGRDYVNELEVLGDAGQLTARPFFSKPPNRIPTLTVQFSGSTEVREFAHDNQFAEMLKEFSLTIENLDLRRRHRDLALENQRLLEGIAAHASG